MAVSENVKLQMGDYFTNTHMFAIEMDCRHVVLGVKWLRTLGCITMEFLELFNEF